MYQNVTASYSAQNQVTSTNAAGFTWTPSYDNAGDVTDDGKNQYLYDAEGRLCAVYDGMYGGMTGYLYDAAGNRVAKGTLNWLSCDMGNNGFKLTNQYILGQGGEQVSEMTVSGGTPTWAHTNVYAGGQLVATYDPGGLHFQLSDWLGTRRVETDYAGNTQLTCANLPFGDGAPNCVTPAEQFFTGYQRDTESGNDYAQARYYASNMGRFITPDPYDGSYDINNPQSFNRYAYVNGNPLTFTDPSGLAGGLFNFPGFGKVCKYAAGAVPCSVISLGTSIYCSIESNPVGCGPKGWTGVFIGGDTAKVIDDSISAIGTSAAIWCVVSGPASPACAVAAVVFIYSIANDLFAYFWDLFGPSQPVFNGSLLPRPGVPGMQGTSSFGVPISNLYIPGISPSVSHASQSFGFKSHCSASNGIGCEK